MQAIQFHNFTDEDFTWKWDGIPYTFPAGSTMFLEDYKAEHFAQHLVDHEMNKRGIPTNNLTERKKLGALCFPTIETVTPLEALQRNKGKKVSKKQVEEEFPDLTEEKSEVEVVAEVPKTEKTTTKKESSSPDKKEVTTK